MDAPIGKVMPYSLEAEQAVLGAMLLNVEALAKGAQALQIEDFYMPAHQLLFEKMLDMFNTNTPVDVITLSQALGDKLESIGGISYLAGMSNMVVTIGNVKQYIDIVKTKAVLRRLIEATGKVTDLCFAQQEELPVILDAAQQLIFDVVEGRSNQGLSHIKDIVFESLAQIEELKRRGEKIVGVPTGFTELDEVTAGLQKSDLILLAARPSMGKTAFALNIAEHAALNKERPTTVAIFNLEMSKSQLVNRMLSTNALIPSTDLRSGNLNIDAMRRLSHAVGEIMSAPIYIDDNSTITVSEIRAKCRRLKAERNLGLVIIDYLQLMQSKGGGAQNRQQEVSDISRSLKILAKELDVPIICLSQLSRQCESRPDKRPMLSDLRESGAIEQDADIVMFLYRDEYYNKDTEEKNIAECIISKHRNGENRTIKLAYRGEFVRFTNLAKMG